MEWLYNSTELLKSSPFIMDLAEPELKFLFHLSWTETKWKIAEHFGSMRKRDFWFRHDSIPNQKLPKKKENFEKETCCQVYDLLVFYVYKNGKTSYEHLFRVPFLLVQYCLDWSERTRSIPWKEISMWQWFVTIIVVGFQISNLERVQTWH